MDDEPPTSLKKKISDEEKRMMVSQLIGLGESQRKIYERLDNQLILKNTNLSEVYKLHQEELELLIGYQNENNGA